MYLEDVECFFAAGGFKDVVSEALDGLGDDFSYIFLIFDNEDEFAVSLSGLGMEVIVVGDGGAGFGPFGEIEAQCGSASECAIEFDIASGLFDKAVDHAESESTAFSDFFGGKERVKGAFLYFGCHACAIVLDGDADVVAGLELCGRSGMFGAMAIGCGDEEVSAVRHGVSCVEGEVEQSGFELCAVDFGVP